MKYKLIVEVDHALIVGTNHAPNNLTIYCYNREDLAQRASEAIKQGYKSVTAIIDEEVTE
jgi:hypothetical protein